jgi:NitT/TauT family transport system permease protein
MTTSDPHYDADEARRARNRQIEAVARWAVPLVVVLLNLLVWNWFSNSTETRGIIFPAPPKVWDQFIEDYLLLFRSLWVTLKITLMALAIAIFGGVALAILFDQSRLAELVFMPYAVVLQVTPIISIAPLIFIYVHDTLARVLICAWIVAFFPVLSNTSLGLKSTDTNLRDLFSIYGGNWWQKLLFLQLPSAMPYFLGALRIAGGLALIGAIVAEFIAGVSGSGGGLAYLILEAGYRYNYPRMFAALLMIMIIGVIIFSATTFISWFFLRKWHESALSRER